jgi:hypothetical protein
MLVVARDCGRVRERILDGAAGREYARPIEFSKSGAGTSIDDDGRSASRRVFRYSSEDILEQLARSLIEEARFGSERLFKLQPSEVQRFAKIALSV